jgi:phosphate:Na+ symporter
MSATHLIINLVGLIALLLWGIHMVQSGVTRVLGSDLRRVLGRGLTSRFHAFLVGLGVTAALQSSTATALMATSLTGAGAVALVPALAIMLGANVGTTLIVQVLSFDVTVVFPVLIALGVFTFRRGRGTRIRTWVGWRSASASCSCRSTCSRRPSRRARIRPPCARCSPA